MEDSISKQLLKVVSEAKEPLGTDEIREAVKARMKRDVTRIMVLYRLNELRAEQKIEGKHMSGKIKAAWIWWKRGVFA